MKSKSVWMAAGIALLFGFTSPLPAQVFTTLHTFTGTPDGASPVRLTSANGVLYGSTYAGGANNSGSIFSFDTNSATFAEIYSFTGATGNGSYPNNLLVNGSAIYGTSIFGGTNASNSEGMIYSLNTGGTGFNLLHSFNGVPDGALPGSTLILGGNTLYGTANNGGTASGDGTIFKINTDGSSFATLHLFTNTPDGAAPASELVQGGGLLFGIATSGGTASNGVIYMVGTNGLGYSVMHSFSSIPDAIQPYGGLVLSSGILYGTGLRGGTNNGGAIFAINTNGTGYRILYSFPALTGDAAGAEPKTTMTFVNGYLYGTTDVGGSGNGGVVFLINTNGSGYTVICNFTNGAVSGSNPMGVIRLGSALWGTTYQDGAGYGTLFKIPLPAVISQPQSLSVTNTSPAAFSVTAADDSTISYQWYFNTNTLLSGQTGPTLSFASVGSGNGGYYTVVASDGVGSVTSSPALLTVTTAGSPPTITQNPQNYTAIAGNSASFTNAATGTGTLFYQWYFNTNTPVSGGTSPILILTSLSSTQAGYYSVIVTNLYGSATSSAALLTVTPNNGTKPSITQNPQNISVTNGYNASFTNAATGTAPLSYQWYFNTNTPVAGGTNPILLLTFATTNQAGYYSVIVTNAAGSATSAPAVLTIISTKPIIFTQPQPLTVTNGAPVEFTVVAAGQNPLRYQWYTNSVTSSFALSGQTNGTVSFASATASLAGNYLVVITNTLGKATSSPALLTVSSKPLITQQPQNVLVTNGYPASFSVAATGPGILSYQWYFRTNTLLTGATNTTVTFTNAITNLAGYYSVRVTNTFGVTTSSYALLSISNHLNFLSFAFNPTNGSASFALANLAHTTNRLWASSNLASAGAWTVIGSNVMATNGLWFFTDTNTAKTNKARFYRFSNP
jgi:uncharacterized repeat protein (TIGR03803 family)